MNYLNTNELKTVELILEELKQNHDKKNNELLIKTLLFIYCGDEILNNGIDESILDIFSSNTRKLDIETNEFYCNLKLRKRNAICNIYVSCDKEIYNVIDITEVINKNNNNNQYARNNDIKINHYCKKYDLNDKCPVITKCDISPLYNLDKITKDLDEKAKENIMKKEGFKPTKYKINNFISTPIYTYNYQRTYDKIKELVIKK